MLYFNYLKNILFRITPLLAIVGFCVYSNHSYALDSAVYRNNTNRVDAGFEIDTKPSVKQTFISGRLEYAPSMIQQFGVLGIGGIISSSDSTGTTLLGSMSAMGYGTYLRYQFKYIHPQVIVPYLGYTLERRSYRPNTSNISYSNLQSPFFGAQFSLSELDQKSAKGIFENVGIKRSYLITEFRDNFSPSQRLKLASYNFIMGLRLEF